MLPPMNENSHSEHMKGVQTAAQSVALESMSKAATAVKQFYEAKKDGFSNIRRRNLGKKGIPFFLKSGDSDINSQW